MAPIKSKLVQVDKEICESLANILRNKTIPEDREEIHFEGFGDLELGNLLFFVVAICHQTSSRGHKPLVGRVGEKTLRGWDFLLQRFAEESRSHKQLLNINNWVSFSGKTIQMLFRNSNGEDLLSEVDKRAALINNLGKIMLDHSWRHLQDLYELCDGRIATGSPNLIETLGLFRAYDDPVRKKSYFLLSLMRNTGLWTFNDLELLGAPVDYHEVRGHLRIGTVKVVDETLQMKLLNQFPVSAEEDIALREAVLEAIILLSRWTGLNNPSQLHYMFWNVFRNYCTREDPNCLGQRRETYLPQRYRHLTIPIDGKAACPFSSVCTSVRSKVRYTEHVFETDYY